MRVALVAAALAAVAADTAALAADVVIDPQACTVWFEDAGVQYDL